jgi:hypothetical protein
MSDLLAAVTKAHGDPASRARLEGVTARMTIGGPFWAFKGQPALLGDEIVEIDARRQHIKFTSAASGRVIEFDNDARKVVIRDGDAVEERIDPRASFAGYTVESKWDATQTAYFISYAVWHYLMEPFVFSFPGVQAHEIDPWEENGELWRRLSVTYPDSIATHSSNQIYYFDQEGMQRRMDYAPDINGTVPIAHYTHQHRTFDGFVMPTKRTVYRRHPDGTADMAAARITLDIAEAMFR